MSQMKIEAAAERDARRYFDAMPRTVIAARLVPIRKALYRGTRAYTAVSFVLAYYGVDFTRNALRVVQSIAFMEPSPALEARLSAAGFKDDDSDLSRTGALEVSDAVEALYRRDHSDTLMRAYLRARVDGVVGEDRDETLGILFCAFPTDVLRASTEPDEMETIADCVNSSAEYGKAIRILRRLEHARSPQTSALARRLRGALTAIHSR